MIVEREKIEEGMFFAAYFLLLTFSMLGHIPTLGGYLKTLTNISLIAFAILIFFRNRILDSRDFIILLIMVAYAFLIIARTGDYGILKMALIMAATKGMNFKKIIRADIVIRLVLMVTIFVLYFKGIAPDAISYFPERGITRHSYGFQNSNHLGLLLTIVVLEYLYLKNMRITLWRGGIQILAIIIFSDYVSGSRTAEAVAMIALILAILNTIFPDVWYSSAAEKVMSWSFPFFSMITAATAFLFSSGNPAVKLIDQAMSGRIALIVKHYAYAGFSLFGTDISNVGRTLDSLYAYLWIGLGTVSFCAVLVAYILLVKRSLAMQCAPLALTLFCFSVYGLSERLWMNIDYNIMMLAFRELLYGDIIESVQSIDSDDAYI